MEVKTTAHLDGGNVEFVARLDEEETSFLIEFAINQLLAMGVTPFLEPDRATLVAGTETVN